MQGPVAWQHRGCLQSLAEAGPWCVFPGSGSERLFQEPPSPSAVISWSPLWGPGDPSDLGWSWPWPPCYLLETCPIFRWAPGNCLLGPHAASEKSCVGCGPGLVSCESSACAHSDLCAFLPICCASLWSPGGAGALNFNRGQAPGPDCRQCLALSKAYVLLNLLGWSAAVIMVSPRGFCCGVSHQLSRAFPLH